MEGDSTINGDSHRFRCDRTGSFLGDLMKMPLRVDKNHCTICGKRGDLELHHISQEPELLIPLCKPCHYKVHHQKGYYDHLQPEMSRSNVKEARTAAMKKAIQNILDRHMEDTI